MALKDPVLKEKLINTESAKEPMEEFCRIAGEYGCPINMGDLLSLNETLWSNLLKSTNGGATFPIDEWADAYEQFIYSLKF
ncbi:MAG: hypothetical protein Q4F63_01510 [Clostridia bacterium]|nr:hypothetical protein [Clostridia bacterium]